MHFAFIDSFFSSRSISANAQNTVPCFIDLDPSPQILLLLFIHGCLLHGFSSQQKTNRTWLKNVFLRPDDSDDYTDAQD
jgi:hypothetical protein